MQEAMLKCLSIADRFEGCIHLRAVRAYAKRFKVNLDELVNELEFNYIEVI